MGERFSPLADIFICKQTESLSVSPVVFFMPINPSYKLSSWFCLLKGSNNLAEDFMVMITSLNNVL